MSAVLNFKVNAGVISCASNLTIPANTVQHVRSKFIFEEDWSEYSVKIATFTNETSGHVRRAILDADDICVIPWETLAGGGALTIDIEGRATLADDTSAIARATTEYTIRLIENDIHTDGSEDTVASTPDILTKVLDNIELIDQYAKGSQSAQESAKRAEASAKAAAETEERTNLIAETLTEKMDSAVKAAENAEAQASNAAQSASDASTAADRAEAAAATVEVFPTTIQEVENARVALDGTKFDNLSGRLDVMEEKIENG